jgi:membrane-bound lytic murein transglycosylase MltF
MAAGEPLIEIRAIPETLEDEDLIEMVNAGLLPFIIVDEHKARFWKQIFPDITIHEQPIFREGGVIAWAVRKESTQLLGMLNKQIAARRGKQSGSQRLALYLKQNRYVKSAAAEADRKKFLQLVDLFRQYGGVMRWTGCSLRLKVIKSRGSTRRRAAMWAPLV